MFISSDFCHERKKHTHQAQYTPELLMNCKSADKCMHSVHKSIALKNCSSTNAFNILIAIIITVPEKMTTINMYHIDMEYSPYVTLIFVVVCFVVAAPNSTNSANSGQINVPLK